ncbi:MAG TPA: hypothetical protein VGK16_05445 [Candidatus Limnocylindrales bacterium]
MIPDEKLDLGTRVNRLCALVAREGQELDEAKIADLTWAAATADLQDRPTDNRNRGRATRLMVAAFAASYGRYMLPTRDWRLVGVEEVLGPGARVDQHWVRVADGAHLYDEIKTALRPGNLGPGPTRDQLDRYVEAGVGRWGSKFIGVRLLYVAAPRRSRLFRPGGRSVLLEDTELWFEGRRGYVGARP